MLRGWRHGRLATWLLAVLNRGWPGRKRKRTSPLCRFCLARGKAVEGALVRVVLGSASHGCCFMHVCAGDQRVRAKVRARFTLHVFKHLNFQRPHDRILYTRALSCAEAPLEIWLAMQNILLACLPSRTNNAGGWCPGGGHGGMIEIMLLQNTGNDCPCASLALATGISGCFSCRSRMMP